MFAKKQKEEHKKIQNKTTGPKDVTMTSEDNFTRQPHHLKFSTMAAADL
jgi:hypothetical protein